MKETIELTKIFLKSSISSMDEKMGVKGKQKAKLILYILLALYFVGLVSFFSYSIIDGLMVIRQEEIFIGLILFLAFGVSTIQTIFSAINILYFAKDNEYILPLPLKPYQIILARTNVMLIAEYAIILLIGLLPLCIYGFLTGAGILYYIGAIFAIFFLPILPVLLVSIIVMIIMSFAKLTKNKGRFEIIATILLVSIVMFVVWGTSNTNGNIELNEFAKLLAQGSGMINVLKGYFPTIDFLIELLTANSGAIMLIQALKTASLTLIGFIAYILIAQKIYFKGLVGNLFGGETKKAKSKIKEYKNSKLYKSYIGKEFKTLMRNPIFFMQCILPSVLIPILIVVMTLVTLNGGGEEGKELLKMLEGVKINTFSVSTIILVIIQLFTMFIYVSITAISRDGKNAVFMKYIPVKMYRQYIYKIIPNVVSNIFTNIISLAIAWYILHIPLATLVMIFVLSTIMAVFQSLLMIIIDLKRPKLEWDSEYAVVKQNLNLIFPAILSMINMAVLVLAGIIMKDINVYIGLGILVLLYLLVTLIVNSYLKKNQTKLATNIT